MELWARLVVDGPPFWQAVFWVGMAVYVFALLWLLVCAFREGIAWGIGLLVFPILTPFFAIIHWDKARGAVGAWVIGLALILVPQKYAGGRQPATAAPAVDAGLVEYGPGSVYRYTDRFGRVHLVNDLAEVPEAYRSRAQPIVEAQ